MSVSHQYLLVEYRVTTGRTVQVVLFSVDLGNKDMSFRKKFRDFKMKSHYDSRDLQINSTIRFLTNGFP